MEVIKGKFLEIKNEIENANKIILTAHVNPDGDAVGSGLGLFLTLKNEYKNKEITFLLQDEIPYTTKFLKFSNEIKKYDSTTEYSCDLLIFLDSATKERTGEVHKAVKFIKTINIDHHLSNPEYGDINCVIKTSSSTSQIIYKFIKLCNYKLLLASAEALYLGLINDTGNFSHSNVTKEVFEMATDLVDIGVNSNYIVTNFFNSNSFASLKLLGEALKNFEYYKDKKLSYYYLDQETMKKYEGKKEDTEGLVEKILSYSEANISLFLRQDKNDEIKGSMRSKYDIDVNEIANIFGGGGHKKAAGFSSKLSAETILNIILEKI